MHRLIQVDLGLVVLHASLIEFYVIDADALEDLSLTLEEEPYLHLLAGIL